jgi:uncharacterized protein YggU (UPF0235/DUF167 family)
VIKTPENVYDYKVRTTAVPTSGKANEAIIKLLAAYFQTGKNNVMIIKGFKSTLKTVEVII